MSSLSAGHNSKNITNKMKNEIKDPFFIFSDEIGKILTWKSIYKKNFHKFHTMM